MMIHPVDVTLLANLRHRELVANAVAHRAALAAEQAARTPVAGCEVPAPITAAPPDCRPDPRRRPSHTARHRRRASSLPNLWYRASLRR